MSYQSEAELEKSLLKKLETLGYEIIRVPDYDALIENFRAQINRFNCGVLGGAELSDTEFGRLMNYLTGKSVFQCAKQLRDQFVLDRDDGTTVYLKFLSQDYTQNIYQVTNQVTVEGKYTNRYDVTVLCNGFPIVQIELKRSGVDIKEAINQIDRYKIHSYRGLYHYVQIFVVSNAVETRYFANSDAQRIMKSLTFYWTGEDNERINNLNEFSDSFLGRSRLNRMINRYMVISESDHILMVMRPYQIFATEALIRRALETNKGGFIFHTTGSGKTLTSWKCAQLLTQEERIKKVIFLVDRSDLDTQTMQEYNRFEDGCVDATDDTRVLVKQLKDKNKKLICTTIQKMAIAVKSDHYRAYFEPLAEEKVIFIIDECHRSQFGKMHNDIKRFFRQAQYFGFTGTPRFKENKSQDGRTTADIFGECLHSYMINRAIFDRNVLGFSVEYISTYQGQYDENDSALVEAIDKTEVLESDERVSLIVDHIITHHKAKSQIGKNKYTAIFATSSIPMLVKYYDEFKRHNHNMRIAAVFSYGTNEDLEDKTEHSRDQLERIIKDYNQMFGTNYSMDTFAAYNADISKRLKVTKIPEIDLLIVVNMYLTGFDSRPLNTLYVDKNLEWHGLLQAFSRTNRVEKETKQFGNIVCYRNLKGATDRALALFSGGGDLTGILMQPYEHYLEKFKEAVAILHKVVSSTEDIDKLMFEEEQLKFVLAFREMSKILLSLETFTDFTWADIESEIDQQTYEDFKSRYFTLHDQVIKRREVEKESILVDIDFNIEIMETDRINVAYIMNLLRNIDFTNKEQKKKDIQHIFDELDRSDSPDLKRKIDLIRAFIGDVIPKMQDGDSVDEAYAEFEDKARAREIEAFALLNGIDIAVLKQAISEFEFSGIVDQDFIDKNMCQGLGFKARREMRQTVAAFINDNCMRFAN